MRKFLLATIFAFQVATVALFVLPAVVGEAAVVSVPGLEKCFWDDEKRGVLTQYQVVESPDKKGTPVFTCYMRTFLKGNTTIIVTAAVALVVFSGAQYMLAMGNSTNQSKAKTRILGVVTGIIFLTLIQFILNIIGL